MIVWGGAAEICNGTDDDCNGVVDDGANTLCDDGNACTEDSCDPPSGCQHAPIHGGQTTCGIGACERTVTTCVDGVPQACVPDQPTREVCDGIDNDCDEQVDEGVRWRIGNVWAICQGRALPADEDQRIESN